MEHNNEVDVHEPNLTEQIENTLENVQEAVESTYENVVEAINEAHIPEKLEYASKVISENLENAVEVVQETIENAHIPEKIAAATEYAEEKIEKAIEMVENKFESEEERAEESHEQKRETESDRAKKELNNLSRPRSNSKLGSMIGLFEKKVEEINNSLTPGVNKLAKESPRGERTSPRPRSNSGNLSDRATLFENKVGEDVETRSRSSSGVHDESPRPRSNSNGKLGGMIGMFEKKVEELNNSLTPGVNAPKPPKPTSTTVRKNSFGKKVEEEAPVEEKKKYKFEVKVTNLTSEKKNTQLLKAAVKEESWEKRRKEEEEEEEEKPRPRKNSLNDLKKQWEVSV
jgi:hypothetical protein